MAVPRGVAASLPSFVALPMAVYLVFVLWGSVDTPRYLPGVPFRSEGSIVARVHRRASRKLLECLKAQVICLPDEDVTCQKAEACGSNHLGPELPSKCLNSVEDTELLDPTLKLLFFTS